MTKFKKGDYVYFRSSTHGTIPAIVKRVGTTTKKKGSYAKYEGHLFISGDVPNKSGFIHAWVSEKNCILQSDDMYGVWREADAIQEYLEKHITFKSTDCLECAQVYESEDYESGDEPSDNAVAKDMLQAGWTIYNSGYYQTIGLCCPDCIETLKAHDS